MAVINASVRDVTDFDEPITVDDAYARSCRAALADSAIGTVGLEIETHLVDLAAVARPRDLAPGRDRHRRPAGRGVGRSAVTVEPGGQVELSGPPDAEHRDGGQRELRHGRAAGPAGSGRVAASASPMSAPTRCGRRGGSTRGRAIAPWSSTIAPPAAATPGAVMMDSTAAHAGQPAGRARAPVAGPGRPGAPARADDAGDLGQLAVAARATTPAGSRPGSGPGPAWTSGLAARCRAAPTEAALPAAELDPAEAWARYAMRAPVAFVQRSRARTRCWRSAQAGLVRAVGPRRRPARRTAPRRPPTSDTHLTTLFPPVRLRGYLELRYLDMTAPRWWPAIAAVVTTLLDDPAAADAGRRGDRADRAGCGPRRPATACADSRLAESAAPLPGHRGRVTRPAEPGHRRRGPGRTGRVRPLPGDLLAERIAQVGPARRIRGAGPCMTPSSATWSTPARARSG